MMRRFRRAALLVLPLFCAAGTLRAQQPLNLGFERESSEGPTRPWGWVPSSFAQGAAAGLDSVERHGGRRSLRIARPDAGGAPYTVHSLSTYIEPRMLLGRRARVTAWLRADGPGARATLDLRAWGPEYSVLHIDSAAALSGGTAEWTRHEVEIPIDSAAHTLVLTASLAGTGTAWFDDLTFEVDGTRLDAVPVAREPTADEIGWLAGRSTPLRTVDPPAPGERPDDADLESFARIVGDARIVALGESTHGTGEFFRVKHRLLEHLVREHGFTLFAIEANQLATERINAYVRGAPDTAEAAMRGMFQVWNTEEMRALVEWMRAHNAAHPARKVEFVGFDMQDPSLPADSLRAFAARRDPALAAALDSLHGPYREAWRRGAYPQAPDSVLARWRAGAGAAWRLAEARREEWLRGAATAEDSAAVEYAVQNARVVHQAAVYTAGNQPDRDSAMAANLAWHLARRPPGTRAVVWAHDSHISRGAAPRPEDNYFASSMGAYLDRLFGSQVRRFGIMTYDGRYTAARSMWGGPRGMIAAEAFPAPAGSIEEALHRVARSLGAAQLLADLRAAPADPGGRWLLEGRPYRFVGYAAEDYGFSGSMAPAHQLDAVIFIGHTTPSRLLR
jgi:erythromycin esterase-like protein